MSKIIFIGGGNIAEAIFAKLSPENLIVIDHNNDRINYLDQHYPNITVKMTLDYQCNLDDLVILAIKPQNAKETCLKIANKINDANIISVMAGITISSLNEWLRNTKITRVMPNTPSLLNMGMTGIYFSPNSEEKIQNQIIKIFSNIGVTHIVKSEDEINKITAIAASSPAYVFYFIESLINSAVKDLGFAENDAYKITLQVLKGSLAMVEQNSNIPISTLRQNVTSKGGTTAAAINVLQQKNLQEIISQAEIACYNRAVELGNNYK